MNEWWDVAISVYLMQNRRTSMPSAGKEPVIPAVDQLHDYILDLTVTGIGQIVFSSELLSPVGLRRCSRSWSVVINRKKLLSNFQNRKKIGDFEKLVFPWWTAFFFSFSVISINFQIRNMTEGWAVAWVKERKDIVPKESSYDWVFWPSAVFFPWCWFGTPHFPVVAQVGLFFDPFSCSSFVLAHRECYMQLLPTVWEGIYVPRIPAELITTRPHNLGFFGVSQSYENL